MNVVFTFLHLFSVVSSQEWVNCTNTLTPTEYSSNGILTSLAEAIPTISLKGFLEPSDKRYDTFYNVMRMMVHRNAKILVETGTSRRGENCFDDGCSTLILGSFANILGLQLYSVDIDEKCCVESRKAAKIFGSNVEVIQSDSVAYLANFNKGLIDFLYLDSFDFDWKNPNPSQEHHLKEIEAVYSKIHKKTIIMLDDCALKNGGKCTLVSKFLDDQGWKVHTNGYQIIYTYE